MPDPVALPSRLVTRRGLMLVLSSPSGAGKTSISRRVLELEAGLALSVSVTTRPRRPSEVEGVHYFFVGRDEFARMAREGELLEHAEVYGNFYGTPRRPVENALGQGRDILFDVDWQGAQQLRHTMRDEVVSLFILPPSVTVLAGRLRTRAEDDDATVAHRLDQVASDLTHWAEYDYVLVNEDFESSTASVRAILAAERLRKSRQTGLNDFVNELRRSAKASRHRK